MLFASVREAGHPHSGAHFDVQIRWRGPAPCNIAEDETVMGQTLVR